MKKISLVVLLATLFLNVFSQNANKNTTELQYYVNLAGKTDGTISKDEILKQKSLSFQSEYENAYHITSFKLTLVRKNSEGGIVEIENNQDGKLNPKMFQLIEASPSGTKLLFEYINVTDNKDANSTIFSHPLSFVIE
jgi:hypothetical protein